MKKLNRRLVRKLILEEMLKEEEGSQIKIAENEKFLSDLNKLLKKPQGSYTPQGATAPRKYSKVSKYRGGGNPNKHIKLVQQFLKALGYYKGEIDGKALTTKVQNAPAGHWVLVFMKFQKDHQLTGDANLGPKTAKKMLEVLSSTNNLNPAKIKDLYPSLNKPKSKPDAEPDAGPPAPKAYEKLDNLQKRAADYLAMNIHRKKHKLSVAAMSDKKKQKKVKTNIKKYYEKQVKSTPQFKDVIKDDYTDNETFKKLHDAEYDVEIVLKKGGALEDPLGFGNQLTVTVGNAKFEYDIGNKKFPKFKKKVLKENLQQLSINKRQLRKIIRETLLKEGLA